MHRFDIATAPVSLDAIGVAAARAPAMPKSHLLFLPRMRMRMRCRA